jgi:hypoxanthine phosphoribosyltransferase
LSGSKKAFDVSSPILIGEPAIRELISESDVQRRVTEIGAAITRDYPNHDEPLLLVGVLKGATLFLADVVRKISRPVEIDFVAISSYGAATQSSCEVRILKDLDADVSGKHVIIIEDILDTGLTIRSSYLVESLRARRALSVKVCVLLDKPARRQAQVEVHYRGFEISNEFVVGYGMDYAEKFRNLPFIGIVELEAVGDMNAAIIGGFDNRAEYAPCDIVV